MTRPHGRSAMVLTGTIRTTVLTMTMTIYSLMPLQPSRPLTTKLGLVRKRKTDLPIPLKRLSLSKSHQKRLSNTKQHLTPVSQLNNS